MTTRALIFALLWTVRAGAAYMHIRVCNESASSDKTVKHAMRVINAIFDPLHIAVAWSACKNGGPTQDLVSGLPITIRLRSDSPEHAPRGDETDLMGRAFTSDHAAELQADTYYRAIKELAQRDQNDFAEALAYIIAHEIGHLLLGEGHVEGTIMCTRWTSKTLAAAERRQITFNSNQRAALHRELLSRLNQGEATRTAAPPPDPTAPPYSPAKSQKSVRRRRIP